MQVDTLVLGIGNVLWADEGFGVRAVEALHRGWSFPDSVRLVDGGTQGLYLLPEVQAAGRVLLFDAIDYRLPPGTLRIIRDGDIPSGLSFGKMSPHQSSFQEVLSLARLAGAAPSRVALVGVQPEVLADFGGSLSPCVREKLPQALEAGLAILAEWGIAATPRREPPAEPLCDPSLALEPYESGRPGEDEACRKGDARILARRARAEQS
jgi:hydrogenase maturation protease